MSKAGSWEDSFFLIFGSQFNFIYLFHLIRFNSMFYHACDVLVYCTTRNPAICCNSNKYKFMFLCYVPSSGVARNFNWGTSFLFPSPFLPPFVHPFPFLPFYPSPVLSSFSSLPFLRIRTPKIQLRSLGEHCELPSGVWSGAPAEIEFGAF